MEIVWESIGYIIFGIVILTILMISFISIYTGKYLMLLNIIPLYFFIDTFFVDKYMKIFGRY